MNAIDHLFHVGIAAGKLLGINVPIAFGSLPAVIERHPAEAELSNDGQGIVDLLGLEPAAIAPSTPDRLKGLGWGLWETNSLSDHDLAVFTETGKVIAVVNSHECAEGLQ